MRYLSKTYLGDAASVPATPLDTMWYNGSAFGIRSSALSDTLYAVWGYDVDYVSVDDADFYAWSNQPTNLLGTGVSRTLWHSNSMNGTEGLWRDTNYFFGLTHETLQNNDLNIIHAYHRYSSIDDIIQCADNEGEYSSSIILWMWDVRHYDPFKTTYSTLRPDRSWEYAAYHYIYNSGNVRPQWKAHTNIYDSIEAFSIYTLETGHPDSGEYDHDKYINSSIHYLMGTVDRSFNGYYTSSDVGRDDIEWGEGMSLSWKTYENAVTTESLRPENSMLYLIRSSRDNIDRENVHEHRYIFSYLGYPGGGKNCSSLISARFIYGHDNDSSINDDTFLYSHEVFRAFNIQQEYGVVDQGSEDNMQKFISNEDMNEFNSHSDFVDSSTEWYQFIII